MLTAQFLDRQVLQAQWALQALQEPLERQARCLGQLVLLVLTELQVLLVQPEPIQQFLDLQVLPDRLVPQEQQVLLARLVLLAQLELQEQMQLRCLIF